MTGPSRSWLLLLGGIAALAGAGVAGLRPAAAEPQDPHMRDLTLDPMVDPVVFPHPASGDELSACPAEELAAVCPCTVLDEQPFLKPVVAIDGSSSVFGGGGEVVYHLGLDVAKGVISERVGEFRRRHNLSGKLDAARYFNFHLSPEPGTFTPRYRPNRWTDLTVVFDKVSEDGALLILVSDGVQSTGPSPSCAEQAAKAQGALETWLAKHERSVAALVLKPPTSNVEPCSRHQLQCPLEYADRCRTIPWWPQQQNVEADRRALGSAIDEALESFANPETVQELPPSDLASIVMIGRGRRHHCTGVAIRPNVVLTAGHCLPAGFVVAGIDSDATVVRRRVRSSVKHPSLDAALLELDGPIVATLFPLRAARDVEPPQGGLRFVGFGALRGDGSGFGRRKDISMVATGWGCDSRRASSTGCKPSWELVLPGSGGDDTCYGDSGGPVMELVPWGASCTWRVVGITSRRVADGRRACGDGGIYTRVDVMESWIGNRVKEWSDR